MNTSTLPTPITPFIGRNEELAHIALLFRDPACRLLTLLGSGGIGKTRLAIQAANEYQNYFRDGVCFVPLIPVQSAEMLPVVTAGALQFSFYDTQSAALQLAHFLQDKCMLLVMDNFEHLLEGTSLLTDLLQAAPGLKFLVTSRERLNLQEEWTLMLEGLPVPADESGQSFESYPAVQLFLQRARQVQVTFSLAENKAAVRTICQWTEGLPLGLELAATWLRAMTSPQIAAHMMTALDFLTTPLRNIPERHRSLRTVFEQSWQLLSEEEKSVLMRLSVFRGGFDLNAAEHVASASLNILANLADKSLIRLHANGRYDLHELLRQYAADKLHDMGEMDTITQRHVDYFLNLANQAEAHNFGRDQTMWFDRLEVELDNLRAALSQSYDSATGLRFVGALGWFFSERTHWLEGSRWLLRLIEANPDVSSSLQSKALHSAGALAALSGDTDRAQILFKQALALASATNDRWNMAWALSHLGNYCTSISDQSAQLDKSIQLFRELGDSMGMTHTLIRRSWHAFDEKNYSYMTALLEEAAIYADRAGDRIMLGWVYYSQGCVAWQISDDLRQAKLHLDASLMYFRAARFQGGCNHALVMLGEVEQGLGNIDDAQTRHAEALLSLRKTAPNHHFLISALIGLAGVARLRGQFERAARLLAATNCVVLRIKCEPITTFKNYNSELTTVRAQLSEPVFAAVWEAASTMTTPQMIDYALECSSGSNETLLTDHIPAALPAQPLPQILSPRELDVLHLLAEGLSNAEIGQNLYVSVGTVKVHTRSIYYKLNVKSRTQAVVRAQTLNLL